MKQLKAVKTGYIICSVLMCLTGALLIAYPALSATFFCILFGVIMAVYGIVKIFGYFSKDLYSLAFQFDLALGILALIVSAVILLHPIATIKFLHIIIGVAVVVDSLFKLQITVDAKRFGIEKWRLILAISILTGIAGLLLIFNPFKGASAMMILIGIALLADGVENICVAVCTVKILNRKQIRNFDEEDNDD